MATHSSAASERRIVHTVFKALLIDLLAFTIILPLFPRLLRYYQQQNNNQEGTLLSYALQLLERYKCLVTVDGVSGHRGDTWDVVLLGGFIGSFFSFLQFIVSPWIGRASDTLGRRRVLLFTMIGNIASTLVWLFARSFSTFLIARTIAGLSEGNVQLSIAIISDSTLPENRSKHLALVGIAFAVAFTFGPPIGAWFASIDLTQLYPQALHWGIYPYSVPALVALVLLLVETLYLILYLPETRLIPTLEKDPQTPPNIESSLSPSADTRLTTLRRLSTLQCLFSLLFSGIEFTLVFLTFDVLDYTHMQQGKLLGTMGVLSALIQGGYVRRKVHQVGERRLVLQGITACILGLSCLCMTALSTSSRWVYCGVAFLSLTSGTVVNCLTSLASLQCDDKSRDPRLVKGQALGKFRSFGQLGRALGPIAVCGLYWMTGPVYCYGLGAVVMVGIYGLASGWLPVYHEKLE
ncbi:major facilitator superfamily domain-containing protein [Spinellus fusiger]|nr:major facilitator superfamily domain-containing protein [Spinellus fusiger]